MTFISIFYYENVDLDKCLGDLLGVKAKQRISKKKKLKLTAVRLSNQ
jgi:hypothetical protein